MVENSKPDFTFLSKLKSSNKISAEIKRVIRKIWHFEMKEKKYTELERKADTRIKIMMGGLIKKAGLDYLHSDNAEALYGMLLASKKQLEKKPQILDEWKEVGKDLTSDSKSYNRISQK